MCRLLEDLSICLYSSIHRSAALVLPWLYQYLPIANIPMNATI